MKKLMMVLLALFCVNCVMAQEEWTEEQLDKPKEDIVAYADSVTGFIQIDVSSGLCISDKVYIDNESDYVVQKIEIWADYNGNKQFIPLTTGYNIYPGATKVIFETSGGIRALRKKSLRIKVYGILPGSSFVVNDFNASLYDKSHDLFIMINSNNVNN